MDAGTALRDAREQAGLTQARLAGLTGTSQAAISAYESGAKQPSMATFGRLLEAAGSRLTVERAGRPVRRPSSREHARTARQLSEVLALAEALPTRHHRGLRFPPLRPLAR